MFSTAERPRFCVGVAMAALWAWAGAGCGSSPTAACTPGQSVLCTGMAACQGGQICNADGRSYGPCQCGAVGGASGASGSHGGASGATGAGGAAGAGGSAGSAKGGVSGAGGEAGAVGGSGGVGGGSGAGGTKASGGTGGNAGGGGSGHLDAGVANDGSAVPPMVYPQCAPHGDAGVADAAQSTDLFVLTGRYGHAYSAIGDVNGDGHVDLIAFSSFSASVWLGCGDGTFSTSPIVSDIPTSPLGWADFTGDGRIDLYYTSPYRSGTLGSNLNLNLIVGQPDGTFAVAPQGTMGNPVGVDLQANLTLGVLGDANGDRRVDIIFGGWWVNTNDIPVLYTALGTGSGFFSQRSNETRALGRFGTVDQIEIADIDGDGHLDALVNFHTSTNGTDNTSYHQIVRGNGDGTFKDDLGVASQAAPTLPLGIYLWGQLDGDGKVDAILQGSGGSGQIYWNAGGEAFSAGPAAPSLSFGDFDGDGQADFLVGSTAVDGGSSPNTIVFGDGAHGFGRPLATPALSFDIADLNGDGVSDLLSRDFTNGTTSIYISTAKHPALGGPDINCAPLPAANCATGPTGF